MVENAAPKTVLETILAWSETRPVWQQDALRRIIADGTPDLDALDELLLLCKKEHGDESVDLEPLPLDATHLPVAPGEGESIRLASMENFVGVNQLAPKQKMDFQYDGLTIIYGPNGSGKSGYSRVLKKACRARHAGDIMPDIYNPSPTGNATATLTIGKLDGSTTDHVWEDGVHLPDVLSAITVFDRDCASVHLQRKQDVMFRPFGLDIPDDLAKLCQNLKDKLTEEKAALGRERDPVFQSPIWHANSTIGTALNELKSDSDLSDVVPTTDFTDFDEKRLLELQTDLLKNPAIAASEQQREATRLDQLLTKMNIIRTLVSDEALTAIFKLKQSAITTREAATLAATTAFSDLVLDGIGSVVWKQLWDAARKYSTGAIEAGLKFPPSEGDSCVLCHQVIDAEAAERLSGFEKFIQQDTEAAAIRAEEALDVALSKLKKTRIDIHSIAATRQQLAKRDPVSAKTVLRFMASAKLRKRNTLNQIADNQAINLTPLTDIPQTEIMAHATEIRTYAASLNTPGDGEARAVLESERAELEDRKQSDRLIAIGNAEITRLGRLDRIESCLKDMNTRSITQLGNQIADDLITPTMRHEFQKEIVELVANRVLVEVVRSGGKAGSPKYEVRFLRKPDAEVGDVLSEGEQTCVALASYLTELANAGHKSALVFDDPVTSLDHRWRAKVAKRLAKEAATRQVIIFTHDLIFVNDLHELALKIGVPVGLANLSRGPEGVGVVNENLPWDKSGIPQRVDILEKGAREAKKLFDAGDDEKYRRVAFRLYSDLRAAWERGLEDILFAGVLLRHRDYIKPTNLEKVTVLENTDVEVFRAGFEKCCDFLDAHDSSRGRDAEPPDPAEILADIEALKQWAVNLKAKQKTV